MSSTSVSTRSTSSAAIDNLQCYTAKGNLFFLLSKVFTLPQLMDKAIAEQLHTIIPDLPQEIQSDAQRLAIEWELALDNCNTLTMAYTRLFLGPFEVKAPPYASFYLEPDQRPMGKITQSVVDAYEKAGLKPGKEPREIPDHIALEWEFMYYLSYRYLTTNSAQWLQQQKHFYTTHLSRWMPQFANAITQADEHAFYNCAAGLISNTDSGLTT